MSGTGGSRIEQARLRAASAKRVLAWAAAGAFAAAVLLARADHPGTAAPATQSDEDPAAALVEDEDDGWEWGGSSVAPSTQSTPQAQSHAS